MGDFERTTSNNLPQVDLLKVLEYIKNSDCYGLSEIRGAKADRKMKKEHEVVISGMAGRFPESDSCDEFFQNLLEKKNLITTDERRWLHVPTMPDVPVSTGKVSERDKMDMTFFGLHRRLCEVTDPNHRISMEVAFAAILDAGINPMDLAGSNTAVIASSVTSETEFECLMGVITIGLAILGHNRALQANRISYYLNLNGPSLMLDNNWSGGAESLAYATDLVARGSVRAAIVVTCSVMYTAEVSYHYNRMGKLTKSDQTKCFSDDADGYNRSEGTVAFFVQRKEDALRSYGTPYCCSNFFKGSKKEALTESSKDSVAWYLRNFYSRTQIDPGLITYLEADGTASKAIDAAELNGVAEVMLPRRTTTTPLLVGSVKSNVGHTEGASSAVALSKVLLAANYGIIPPNINYNKPNSSVPALKSGQIKVLTEATPLEGDYLAVNSISTNATVSHAVVKRHERAKARTPEINVLPPDGLPRLVLVSGRHEEKLNNALLNVEKRPIDEEYVAIVNNVFKKGIKKHSFRGYTVLNDKKKSYASTKAFFTGGQPMQPVWWVFTGMGSQWPGMGTELMKLPVFDRAIRHCHEILQPKGIDLIHILTTPDPAIFNNILHSFVGIAAVQIGLVDVLKELGLTPDGIIGHSVGELGCAYADGCFTAEQMILAAYARGKASIEVELIPGMMAAIGLGYDQMKSQVPDGIEVACHNSTDSCTLSGPKELMKEYVAKLQSKGIFAKLVNVANIAYHSRYIKPAAPALLKYLKEVVPEPKLRSSKWISSSVPKENWGLESARYCSAEYHTNNLLGSVLFEEASVHIPKEAVIVEIAPHGLLQAILKRAFPSASHIPLTRRTEKDGLAFLFSAIGKLYLEGASLEIDKLYPPVEFPVARGTPSLNDLVTWDHSEEWRINMGIGLENYDPENTLIAVKPRTIKICFEDKEFEYLADHVVYNNITIPLSLCLVKIIEDYQKLRKSTTEVLIISDVIMSKFIEVQGNIELYISLCKGTGAWEVCCDNSQVMSGVINFQVLGPKGVGLPCQGSEMTSEQVYDLFEHFGHRLGPSFRHIKSATVCSHEVSAVVEWTGNLVTFLDNVLKLPALLTLGEKQLKLVTSVNHIAINFSDFVQTQKKDVLVHYNALTGLITGEGFEVLHPACEVPVTKQYPEQRVICEKPEFLPLDTNVKDLNALFELSMKLLFNNFHDSISNNIKLSLFEVQKEIDFQDQLYDVVQWISDVEVHINTAGFDTNLEGYISNPESEYCFISTGSEELENSVKVLASSRGGLILLKGVEPPPSLAVIFHVIIEEKPYYLCKVRRELKENPSFVLMSSGDWKTEVIDTLQRSTNRVLYVLGQETCCSFINSTVKACNSLINSHLLRFIFIDTDVSEFDFGSCKEQLAKDLKVNILQAGKWGVLLTQPLNLESHQTVTLKDEYLLSDIRLENSECPKALSMNLSNKAANNAKDEVFEYSGIFSNEKICGIAKHSAALRTLLPDPLLRWDLPEGWSHEDACSVLMSYAMAYWMIRINVQPKGFGTRTGNILIFQGLLPVSQAAIRVSLHRGLNVYISYETQEEYQKIQELFPEVPKENLVCHQESFYFYLNEKSKSNGMDIIINTLSTAESVRSCMYCVGFEGVVFFLNEAVLQQCNKIGMNVFLKQVTINGITPQHLLDIHETYKMEIQQCIEEGFKNGVIKPISNIVISSNTIIDEAVSLFRSLANSDKKVLVQMTERPSQLPNISHLSKTYILLADRNGFWIDLVEWLVEKGACHFNVVISRDLLVAVTVGRLTKLQSLYPHLVLVLNSDSRVESAEEVEMFINLAKRSGILETVFVVGEAYNKSIDYLSEALKEEKLVMISDRAEDLCSRRLRSGLNTLAISVPPQVRTPHILIPRLEKLMVLGIQEAAITEQYINHQIVLDIERTALLQHLPSTVSEILELSGSTEVGWKEVRTSCPHFNFSPELPPVFIIPPLKKGQLDPLIRMLFYPTFMAVLPQQFHDFQDLAQQLHQSLQRFNTGVFSIICSDWSWIVGLLLGKLLEAEGKEVSLIFFEACVSWESPSVMNQVRSLVNKDFALKRLNDKQMKKLSNKMEKGFQNLNYRLNLFSHELPQVKQKLKGICHYIKPNIMLKGEKLATIQEHCEKPVNVFITEEGDMLRIVENKKLATYINTFVLFEYKDAANKVEKVFIKDCVFVNPRLSYLYFMQALHQSRSKTYCPDTSDVQL